MASWTTLLVTYLLGGVTFIPLLAAAIFVHAYYNLPRRDDSERSQHDPDNIVQPGDDTTALDAAHTASRDDAKARAARDLEVAAGYFAVCREYTPMGINAKPIERSTPLGSTTVASPSPSVYQTMYRSIFDRKPAQGPLDNKATASQRPKKAGNVFYVVLRHGHLMLFDDDEQLEVRHVISLAHYSISIYSGGDNTPEGELFIKRSALCLSRKGDLPELLADGQASKPFYLFSENCSAKEDFYFALLKNQDQMLGSNAKMPTPQQFEVKHIIDLVQRLHASEEHLQYRWLNALIGRVFLAVYKTRDLEDYIRGLITKKISRVKKPTFLTNIHVDKMDIGEAAPFFTNMKLKDLTVEGETMVEADVKYAGNFRIEVATTVKIDLGGRFKVREVNLVLAVVLKRLEGHVLFKIKPPPSNRLWFSFQTMPKMEMAIEPIVSARQITYTVILRQIENRIKEVLAETLVQPFWDDIPFFKTEAKKWRGGIFEEDTPEEDVADAAKDPESLARTGDVDALEQAEEQPGLPSEPQPLEKSQTIPVTETQPAATGLFGRKLSRAGTASATSSTSTSTSLDLRGAGFSISRSPKILSPSAEPVVSTDLAHATVQPSSSPPDHANNPMATLQMLSREPSSSSLAHVFTKSSEEVVPESANQSASSSREALDLTREADEQPPDAVLSPRRNTTSSTGSGSGDADSYLQPSSSTASSFKGQAVTLGRNFMMRRENAGNSGPSMSSGNGDSPRRTTLSAVTNVANQARQWGWNAIQRQKEGKKPEQLGQIDLTQPMGRGQPLPPPGTPLPGPINGSSKIAPMQVPKRKPLPSPPLAPAPEAVSDSPKDNRHSAQPAPPLPQRRRRGDHWHDLDEEQNMLVVAAPDDSQPSSPVVDTHGSLNVMQEQQEISSLVKTHAAPDQEDELLTTEPTPKPDRKSDLAKVSPDLGASLAPDESIVAMPVSAVAEDDDDYSGWLDEGISGDELDETRNSTPVRRGNTNQI
ncbi:hypothetical protein B0I35DRAFT_360099 [Stachybotrys elegans]|uniref:SMP-LTD domain-containing protein n=1 Tax=Stachybotrys elegans TaxID=80388 RepID=A0A8K0SG87_9HYPO|nr:hypothetical protein B0I35DRAFT_360099 [Stachybotrys elegans]